jgi:hypothetical protein
LRAWKRYRPVRNFCATKPIDGGFIEKNAASGDYMGDYPTALEYDRSNITPGFRDGKYKTNFARTTL